MNFPASNKTAEHENADNKTCIQEDVNKTALVDLFDKTQGCFSNGRLNLSDVVYEAMNEDRQNMSDILCELVISKGINTKKHQALKRYLKSSLGNVALEMNKSMANSH